MSGLSQEQIWSAVHGVTSLHVFATATSGRSRSADESPAARSIARAGAREGPFLVASLSDFAWVPRIMRRRASVSTM